MAEGLILNTRPLVYRERVHAALADAGLPILDCPLMVPQAISALLPPPDTFDAVIFTSPLGVRFFSSGAVWRTKKVFALGPGTETAAKEAGFTDITRTGFDAEDMVYVLDRAKFSKALYASGEDVTVDLADNLPGRVQRVSLYRMIALTDLPADVIDAAKAGQHIVAPLFSKRSAAVLNDILNKAGLNRQNMHMTAVGISAEVVAGEGPWRDSTAPAEPTLEAVVAMVRDVIRKASP
jgi:uroporphyrinogen-III synthase